MFIHLGGGMSEQDYDGLEHSLRAANGRSQIPKLSALKKNLERFSPIQYGGHYCPPPHSFPQYLWNDLS